MSDIDVLAMSCAKCGSCYMNKDMECADCARVKGRKDDSENRKHSHYFKDTSAYDEMDIYAICKVWNVESSGCTFAALKKLLNGGERGAKDRMTDLHQAIESIERLIALESMCGDE